MKTVIQNTASNKSICPSNRTRLYIYTIHACMSFLFIYVLFVLYLFIAATAAPKVSRKFKYLNWRYFSIYSKAANLTVDITKDQKNRVYSNKDYYIQVQDVRLLLFPKIVFPCFGRC